MTSTFLPVLLAAFMMGLFGGAHCISMCGGIVCALCYSCDKSLQQTWNPYFYQFSYNIGRIITYTLLGAITGLVGMVLAKSIGIYGGYILRVFAALIVIAVGFYVADWWKMISSLEFIGKKIWLLVNGVTRHFIPVTSFPRAFILGGLWGLLPCGLVYSALLYSFSVGTWWMGACVMLFFGLGTLPALLLVGSAMQSYRAILSGWWVRQLSGLILIFFGIVAIVNIILKSMNGYGCPNCH